MAYISGLNANFYQQMSTYRLMSAMSVPKISSAKTVNSRYGMSKNAASLYGNTAKGALSMDTLNFVKDYQSSMSKMMSSAEALRSTSSSSVLKQMKVGSSNTSVAEVKANWRPSRASSYTLNVKQVATGQVNRSNGMSLSGMDMKGDLQIKTEKGTFQFQANAALNNRENLNDLVSKINASDTGVTASIELVEGKASLALTAKETGANAIFEVSGTLAQSSGLDKVAVQAQNAIYSVKEAGSYMPAREYTSESNTVDVDSAYRITADLKSAGTTTIGVAYDTDQTASAIKNLVGSFNDALKLLNDNADRGEGVLKQMRRMVIPPTSERSMALAGVTINKDGTMNFDEETFQKNVAKDPDLVRDVIGGSFGLANGVYNDARQGLNVSSNSLLSEDLKQAKLAAAYNPVNFVGTYSRNGVYNMSNLYAINAMMNLMV